MFEVNGNYANRKGNYTVIAINGPKMKVQYEDGSTADLNCEIQHRIWENIVAEREIARARRINSLRGMQVKHYIKTLSVSEEADLMIPGLRQRTVVALSDSPLEPGDRLIYYAVEPQVFFAVVTVTAKPRTALAKEYFFGEDGSAEIKIYPIDVDAHIESLSEAVSVDSAYLESLPQHKARLRHKDNYFFISEDDFELLAELIMEIDADEEEDDDDDEIEPDEDGFDLDD